MACVQSNPTSSVCNSNKVDTDGPATVSDLIKGLSPLPRILGPRKRTRPSEPSKVLTSTPEKLILEEAKAKKEGPVKKKKKNQAVDASKKPDANKKGAMKQLPPTRPKKAAVMMKVKTKAARKIFAPSTSKETTEEDCQCPYCNEFWSNSTSMEEWLACQVCGIWAHTLCTPDPEKIFVCLFCMPE